jgi:3-methylcrotonyl-CoA carboxylase alpha subunit
LSRSNRRSISRLMVANRGEIARRVFRSCRKLGIETVAVYSDPDRDLPFVRDADVAVHIGPAAAAESYLNVPKLLDAAKRAGAGAIHPGYGFLAENAAFAQACGDAGIVWVGPTPESIAAMGKKREAKEIARKAGVPVIPGYDGADQDPAVLAREAERIGFPVLLKPSAGGGGKGMRIVRKAADLAQAIAGSKREAASSFGDDTLLVEKYVERPRHIEIQILGDQHGNLVHLFERECSLQRRHQKIVEESPSTAVSEELRETMGQAALSLARAIRYESAGTVEFILAPDGHFYFLEVNTRIQVEHPVTEELLGGIDLVEEQIRIAMGEERRLSPRRSGAVIEARLYAEDPANGFLPQSGRLSDYWFDPSDDVRIESGVETGSEVSIHYDPMLAKVIARGSDRPEAIRKLRTALAHASAQGLATNREFLIAVLDHPEFAAGATHTHFVEDRFGDWSPSSDAGVTGRAALAVTAFEHAARSAAMIGPRGSAGFRLDRRSGKTPAQRVEFEPDVAVEYRTLGENVLEARVGDGAFERVELAVAGPIVTLVHAGLRRTFRVTRDGAAFFVHSIDGDRKLIEKPRLGEAGSERTKGGLVAPMPGKIVAVRVAEGDAVAEGQPLVVLEAMKMEHTVVATHAATVERVLVAVNDQVEAAALLVVLRE